MIKSAVVRRMRLRTVALAAASCALMLRSSTAISLPVLPSPVPAASSSSSSSPAKTSVSGKSQTRPSVPPRVVPRFVPQRVAKPLALVPVLERVHLEATEKDLLLTEDVRFSSAGTVQKEALELFVSFGVPGPPRALDVHVLAPAATGASLALRVEFAAHAPSSANVLFGTAHLGGFLVHVPASVAASVAGGFGLRMRTLWSLPTSAPRGVLVRLGAPVKEPVTIARIEYDGPGKLDARFCGTEGGEVRPLSVWASSSEAGSSLQDPFALAPSSARQRATDNLCLSVVER